LFILIKDAADARLDPYRDLREPHLRKRYEHGAGIFVAEGERVLRHLLRSGWGVESVLISEQKRAPLESLLEALEAPVLVAPPEVLHATAGFSVHRGVLAIGRRPAARSVESLVSGSAFVLAVEGVNDHENMGALFRNASAFGAQAVLLDPSCCDPLYRRSVRVSMGAVMDVPFATFGHWPEGLGTIGDAGFTVVALTPSGDTASDSVHDTSWEKVALLVGAEGDGLTPPALAASHVRVRIPMVAPADSLNVATAAAVAMSRLHPAGATPLV